MPKYQDNEESELKVFLDPDRTIDPIEGKHIPLTSMVELLSKDEERKNNITTIEYEYNGNITTFKIKRITPKFMDDWKNKFKIGDISNNKNCQACESLVASLCVEPDFQSLELQKALGVHLAIDAVRVFFPGLTSLDFANKILETSGIDTNQKAIDEKTKDNIKN